MTTEHDNLVARAKELKVHGASTRWTDDKLRQEIMDAEPAAIAENVEAQKVGFEGLPEPAASLPVEVTTEPHEVAANDGRFDVNDQLGPSGLADPAILNPGEEPAAGNGNQDRDFTAASRAADASDGISSQMVTNAEAGIFNEPPPVVEEKRRAKPVENDHLADKGTGAGGPADTIG